MCSTMNTILNSYFSDDGGMERCQSAIWRRMGYGRNKRAVIARVIDNVFSTYDTRMRDTDDQIGRKYRYEIGAPKSLGEAR